MFQARKVFYSQAVSSRLFDPFEIIVVQLKISYLLTQQNLFKYLSRLFNVQTEQEVHH